MFKKINRKKFTQRQLDILTAMKPGNTVRDIRVLKKLALLGVVTLHAHTGEIVRNICGMLVRAFYIDDSETFEVEGAGVFRHRYVSGSIFPYLIKAEID